MSIVIGLSACGLTQFGSISGHVYESDTGEPLKNVYVVASWHGDDNPVHPNTVCIHMVVTKTDDSGYYYIPPQFWDVALSFKLNIWQSLSVYKPGYENDLQSIGWKSYVDVNGRRQFVKLMDEDWYLKDVSATFEKRIKALKQRSGACDQGKMEGYAHEYFKALRQEALSLAKTTAQKRSAWNLELGWWLATRESDSATTDENLVERLDKEMRENAYNEEQNAGDPDKKSYFNWNGEENESIEEGG